VASSHSQGMPSCFSPQKMRAVDATWLHDVHQLLRNHSTHFFTSLEGSTPSRVLPAARRFFHQWALRQRSTSKLSGGDCLPNARRKVYSPAIDLRREPKLTCTPLQSSFTGRGACLLSKRGSHSSTSSYVRGERTCNSIRGSSLQPVDYTTLLASCAELEKQWVPSKVERITQTDKHTVAIGLRTLDRNGKNMFLKQSERSNQSSVDQFGSP
jgi:hypothetical protein